MGTKKPKTLEELLSNTNVFKDNQSRREIFADFIVDANHDLLLHESNENYEVCEQIVITIALFISNEAQMLCNNNPSLKFKQVKENLDAQNKFVALKMRERFKNN